MGSKQQSVGVLLGKLAGSFVKVNRFEMGAVALFKRNRSVPLLGRVVNLSEMATSNNAFKLTGNCQRVSCK